MKFKIVFFLFLILISSSVFAQKTGEEVFKEHACNACHMLTDMKMVGPGLAGILDRRDRQWLKDWIRDSQAMVAAGDELAVQVFEENNKIPMASYDIPDDEMEALLDYIGGVEKKEAVAVETETNTEESTETVVEEVKIKEKSALSKALDGRPILASFFWSTLLLLLLGIVAVLVVKGKKE